LEQEFVALQNTANNVFKKGTYLAVISWVLFVMEMFLEGQMIRAGHLFVTKMVKM
jgi:hypothetical protein